MTKQRFRKLRTDAVRAVFRREYLEAARLYRAAVAAYPGKPERHPEDVRKMLHGLSVCADEWEAAVKSGRYDEVFPGVFFPLSTLSTEGKFR